jgi:signal transduction histidine kinase/CheY-like chemotaxis protein
VTGSPRPDDALLAEQAQVLELIGRRPLAEVLAALCGVVERGAASPVKVAIVLAGAGAPAGGWAWPIVGAEGAALATLTLGFAESRAPSARERGLVEVMARVAALAIERDRADQALRDATRELGASEARYRTAARDVRALVAAERALTESRGRLDYAVRLSGVGFWYCDLPFDELIWDDRVKQHFWLAPDARVTIELFYERIHPDDRAPTRAAIEASIADHTSYDVVYRTVDPASGAVKFIRALGGTAYAADATPLRFDGVTIDVTAQKHAEARFAGVARAALTIHSASSLTSVMRVVTEEARALIGARRAVSVALGETGPVGAVASDRPANAAFEASAVDAVLQHLPGPARHAAAPWPDLLGEAPGRGVLAVPFVGRDGARFGFVEIADKREGELSAADEAIAIQLAQLAVVAIENARLYDQLRDQDRRKDEFLATLAHELRNPLAPIRTGLDVLAHDTTAEQAARTREMMARQLGHLVRMVDDLLEISRVTLGKITLQRSRVDLRDVLASALETTRSLIDARGHALEVRLAEGPLAIDVDPTRLSQVFANLLNNAAKYTPDGGALAITAEVAGPTIVVRVSDSGVGIPAGMLGYVFDMFTQVGRSIERSQGGLGIGLTLVRRLVEMHGGSVAAESPGAGRGSTFVVTLPIAAPAASVAAEVSAPATTGLRVLVVDDNLDAAEMLATLLELRGHEVRMAHTGPDALEVAAAFAPQIVFLDIGLPGLNGYEVARRLRAAHAPAPMLVAVTGWGTDEDRRQAAAAGFDRHLVKPVDLTKLEAALVDVRRAT